MVVVTLALVALVLLAGYKAFVALKRTPAWDAPMPDDARSEARLTGFWHSALYCASIVVLGLVLAAVVRSIWALAVPAAAAAFCLQCLNLMYDTKIGDSWYTQYQVDRVQRGLPPRRWWDGRLD
jgi:hypothetical protein